MPKYSIILPVRNGGEYVKECVPSILAQSLGDLQLQVLDNCSTDGTRDYLQSLRDDRITIYPADRPLTIEENWARITTIPKNEFITLIGHDDVLDVNYLAVMDRLIQKHPDASLYQAHFRYINSSGATIRRCKPMDERQSPQEFIAFFLCNMIDTMGTGFMMRALDYDAAGGLPAYPNLLFADFELWINLSGKSYKATAFEECFSFRLHQSTTTTSADIKYHQAFARFNAFLKHLRENQPPYREVIERYALTFIHAYCKSLAHRLLRTPVSKRARLNVVDFVAQCKKDADGVVPGNNYDPYAQFDVRLAKLIDSNPLTRQAFLLFKKLYSKPVYA
jgi:glycosyltransferase involved in cell wall biosynthesis